MFISLPRQFIWKRSWRSLQFCCNLGAFFWDVFCSISVADGPIFQWEHTSQHSGSKISQAWVGDVSVVFGKTLLWRKSIYLNLYRCWSTGRVDADHQTLCLKNSHCLDLGLQILQHHVLCGPRFAGPTSAPSWPGAAAMSKYSHWLHTTGLPHGSLWNFGTNHTLRRLSVWGICFLCLLLLFCFMFIPWSVQYVNMSLSNSSSILATSDLPTQPTALDQAAIACCKQKVATKAYKAEEPGPVDLELSIAMTTCLFSNYLTLTLHKISRCTFLITWTIDWSLLKVWQKDVVPCSEAASQEWFGVVILLMGRSLWTIQNFQHNGLQATNLSKSRQKKNIKLSNKHHETK